jgi:putative ABC transport system permease protein
MPIVVFAPPAESELLAPTMLEGRWLMPGDENAVVVNTGVLKERPGLDVGDDLSLTVAGRDLDLRVVGIVRDIGLTPILYMDGDYLSDKLERSGRASTIVAVTERHTLDHQTAVASILEDVLATAGVRISLVAKIAQEREEASALLNTVIAVLVSMALLLAIVGALALTGALSLSVLERTREIGVMRAIGASSGQIGRIFMGEALVIALLSWMGGALVAVPLAMVLSRQIGIAMLTMPLSFAYPASGPLAILAAMLVLALLASLLPSRRATRITVREALSYE